VSDKLFRVTTIGRLLLVALETIVDDESRLVDIHVSLLSLVLFYLSLLGLDFVLRAARGVARGSLIKFSLVAAQLFVFIQKPFLQLVISLRVALAFFVNSCQNLSVVSGRVVLR
jgi:hypothetical protein